jgi:hypothetical protein
VEGGDLSGGDGHGDWWSGRRTLWVDAGHIID